MKTLNLDRWILLLIPYFVNSQTTNIGDFFIGENTQVSSIGILDNKSSGNLINDGELFAYNHFNNDGLVGFTPTKTSGTIRLRGLSGYQNISGSIPLDLYNIEFNNVSSNDPSAFHVSNYLNIFGIANFNEGIVDNDSYSGIVIFQNGSSCLNVKDRSFIDGTVQKKGNSDFIFPVGNKLKYRFAEISTLKEGSNVFSAKYLQENAGTLFSFEKKNNDILVINNKEYWVIKRESGISGAILTLSWDESTTPLDIIDSTTDIHIVRWDNNKDSWVDEGGVINNENKTVSTPIDVKGYGVFTTAKFKKTLDSFIVHNAISPNNDGLNDFLKIDGLDGTENSLVIYNRWGVKVYETTDYGSKGNLFNGFSEGRSTITKKEKLPVGTYFYVLLINKENNATKKAGYIYIND